MGVRSNSSRTCDLVRSPMTPHVIPPSFPAGCGGGEAKRRRREPLRRIGSIAGAACPVIASGIARTVPRGVNAAGPLMCILLLALLQTLGGCRKEEAASQGSGRTFAQQEVVAVPQYVDMGSIPGDVTKEARFELTNRGPRTLLIKKVLPDCGCASVHTPQTNIAPKTSVPVVVSIDTGKIASSAFKRSVLIQIADKSAGLVAQVRLCIAGKVDRSRSITLFPKRLDFGELAPGSTRERMLYVRGDPSVLSRLPASLVLEPTSPTTLSITAQGRLHRTISNKAIRVCFRPPLSEATGQWRSFLCLTVSGALQWRGEVQARAVLKPRLRAEPSRLIIQASAAPTTVHILGGPNAKLLLRNVTASPPLVWQCKKPMPTDDIAIMVGVQRPVYMPLPMQADVVAKVSSHGAVETIKIPVTVASLVQEAPRDTAAERTNKGKDGE